MKNVASMLLSAIVALTVLSSAVAVKAAGQENGTHQEMQGTGSSVHLGIAGEASEASQVEYVRAWMAKHGDQPSDTTRSEVLLQVPLYPNMMSRLLAVDVETGKMRHVADFVGCRTDVNKIGPNLAFAAISSILHWTTPVSGCGNPITNNTVALVDLREGNKLMLSPLDEWDTLYAQMSPDRRKIAFLGSKRGNWSEHGLCVADLETLKPTFLLKGGMTTTPAWSPDSRWLAISKAEGYTDQGHEIVLIDTLDATVKSTGMKGAGAKFSPDGKRLVYSGGFKRQGSWMQGVPTSGNLFIAALPDGQPEQLTQLPEGGALHPAFSPDGSLIAYIEQAPEGADKASLHIIDANDGKDAFAYTITEESAMFSGAAQWIDDHSKLVACYERAKEDAKKSSKLQVLLVERTPDAWTCSNSKSETPDAAEDKGVQEFAKRVMDVFVTNSAAIKADDLQQFDEARAKYAHACRLIETIDQDLVQRAGEGVEAVKLQPSDLRPYLEAMKKKADLPVAERSAKAVRTNLEFLPSALGAYYGLYGQFPSADAPPATTEKLDKGEDASKTTSPPSFAEWAADPSPETMQWQVNHIRGSDHERVRCLFVVPGVDPAKTATSYEVVRSGKEDFVLRTPVLADGTRLEATYKVQQVQTYQHEGKQRRHARVAVTISDVK